MIRKLGEVLVLAFAINFLLLGGGVGYLAGTKKLDREKVLAIREIVFPSTQPASPATQPSDDEAPATQPVLTLEDLLTRQAGLSAVESVEFIQSTFNTKMAELDRRQRELDDLQRQVEMAKQQLATDRGKVVEEKKSLEVQKEQAEQQAADKGFQDSLALYTAMPPKQVKSIFVSLTDDIVVRYLQAMQPRQASKILKEFKSPDESSRAQKILEKMRQSQSTAMARE